MTSKLGWLKDYLYILGIPAAFGMVIIISWVALSVARDIMAPPTPYGFCNTTMGWYQAPMILSASFLPLVILIIMVLILVVLLLIWNCPKELPTPAPFDRVSFITLNKSRLFTAERVADLIEKYEAKP